VLSEGNNIIARRLSFAAAINSAGTMQEVAVHGTPGQLAASKDGCMPRARASERTSKREGPVGIDFLAAHTHTQREKE
jgi:hypothetical protein